jgi:hypothetical protein
MKNWEDAYKDFRKEGTLNDAVECSNADDNIAATFFRAGYSAAQREMVAVEALRK